MIQLTTHRSLTVVSTQGRPGLAVALFVVAVLGILVLSTVATVSAAPASPQSPRPHASATAGSDVQPSVRPDQRLGRLRLDRERERAGHRPGGRDPVAGRTLGLDQPPAHREVGRAVESDLERERPQRARRADHPQRHGHAVERSVVLLGQRRFGLPLRDRPVVGRPDHDDQHDVPLVVPRQHLGRCVHRAARVLRRDVDHLVNRDHVQRLRQLHPRGRAERPPVPLHVQGCLAGVPVPQRPPVRRRRGLRPGPDDDRHPGRNRTGTTRSR